MIVTLDRNTVAMDKLTTALEKPQIQAFSPVENGNLPFSSLEIAPKLDARRSPKVEAAMKWLIENPDMMKESNRKIGRQLGISHPTIAEAKRMIESERITT